MTAQSRKHRGYRSQKVLAEYLTENGWPYAETTGAGRPGTDVTGTPGIDWEVFARRDGLTVALAKMRQSAARVGDELISVHVMRPDGYGEGRIADWPAFMPLSRFVELLHKAGYGDGET